MSRELSDEKMAELSEALTRGQKIEAIKTYRELTGLGLKESKDAVEEIETSLRAKFPEKFANTPKAKGCGTAAVVLLAIGGGAIYWLAGMA